MIPQLVAVFRAAQDLRHAYVDNHDPVGHLERMGRLFDAVDKTEDIAEVELAYHREWVQGR